ncbi:MAG: carboxypeptidase regulatory-like domain-containing protein, partial [Armatimonadota bacterium]|nr:carboxypeptidase regulatory-like domain-containing protein [Armatimonadota bacterium]
MRRCSWAWSVLGLAASLLLFGCGDERQVGVVSGTVTDIENGDPIANAEVFAEGTNSVTRTLHNGTFYLTNVPEGFTLIRARAVIRGVEYTGQNVAQVFFNQQTKSVNIMLAPVNQQGTIEGFVRDPSGAGIEGARVFAGGALSSAFAVTDRRGFYRIRGLPAGYEYPVVASAPGYENVKQIARVYANETAFISFTLNRSSNRPVNAPQNLEATAWTFPQELVATRSAHLREA